MFKIGITNQEGPIQPVTLVGIQPITQRKVSEPVYRGDILIEQSDSTLRRFQPLDFAPEFMYFVAMEPGNDIVPVSGPYVSKQ